MPRTISLVVPDGIEPGDSVCFNVGGQDIEFPLPSGAKPGDALQIQVTDSDGEKVKSACSSDTAQLVRVDDDGSCHVSLHPATGKELIFEPSDNSSGASICSELWPTGLVMANIVTNPDISEQLLASVGGENKRKEKQLRALEVGSGLGTVGLALATALDDNSELVLTDYPSAIKMLEANIETNKAMVRNTVNVKAQGLPWGKQDQDSMGAFDIICGSDLLYGDESSYQPLVDTLSALLKQGKEPASTSTDNSGLVLLGVRWRKPEKEKKFFELAQEAGIHFTLLVDWLKQDLHSMKCFKGMPSLSWDKYGKVDDDDFLHHLTQTKVSTGGGKRSVSLAEMNEQDLSDMTDDEHAAFERTQIQIYVGRWTNGGKKRGPKNDTCEGVEKQPKLDK